MLQLQAAEAGRQVPSALSAFTGLFPPAFVLPICPCVVCVPSALCLPSKRLRIGILGGLGGAWPRGDWGLPPTRGQALQDKPAHPC